MSLRLRSKFSFDGHNFSGNWGTWQNNLIHL